MATQDSIFVPSTAPQKVAALSGTTSSSELVFNHNAIIAVQGTGNINVAFGKSGMAAADATGWLIPSGAVHMFDLGSAFDRIRVFNSTGSAVDVYVMQLVRS
jgi:hypothetical protein